MTFQCPNWPPDWPDIEMAAIRSIRSGQWGRYESDASDALQDRLRRLCAVSHVRLCCSGTAAIEIALRAGGVGPGDEVLLSAYDYPGNFRTVEIIGARPVLLDVRPESLSLNLQQIDAASSGQVRALIVSHLFGQAAQVGLLRSLCDQRDWLLIEDACQVPGMMIEDRPAGSFGHFAALSFGGSKPLTAGSGGALLTDDTRLAARLGPLLDRPSDATPMSPLQATVLGPQLDRLGETTSAQRNTVAFLESNVSPVLKGWRLLSKTDGRVSASYYKVAWLADSSQHRQRVVAMSGEFGLPIGEGFRSMAGCSERRCRKPVPLDPSRDLGEKLFVLDHRALSIGQERYQELADYLVQLHDASM